MNVWNISIVLIFALTTYLIRKKVFILSKGADVNERLILTTELTLFKTQESNTDKHDGHIVGCLNWLRIVVFILFFIPK